MRQSRTLPRQLVLVTLAASATLIGCTSYPWLPGFDGGSTTSKNTSSLFASGNAFTEDLLQDRTFTSGTAVTTVTYMRTDLSRTAVGIDFNGDGKIDPVVGYGFDQGVLQILLSRPEGTPADFISLTLDSKRDMQDLSDVAVGDIDGDGFLDLVASASESCWYFRHPASGNTKDLKSWGVVNPPANDELRERIDASYEVIADNELQAIIAQSVGVGVNIEDYIVEIESSYTNVEIADFDKDGDNDIVATRTFRITLTPRPERPVEPIEILDGDVIIFQNPGFAQDGRGWSKISVGVHERQDRLDRDGASGLLVYDVDNDGDFDVVTSARDDNNAQVAWFENPGAPLSTLNPWEQWRIGSIRDAWAVDMADLTGDGKLDVVAVGGAQQQMMLFEQPKDTPKRTYDWDSFNIVTFEKYEPRGTRIVDIDNDGVMEILVSGTNGVLRYFEPEGSPLKEWKGVVVKTFDPPADIGLLGYGDFDADLDLDLIAVLADPQEPNNSRLVWVRNDLR